MNNSYSEEMRPCLTAWKKCGCCIAVCSARPNPRDIPDLVGFMAELPGCTFEWRPVAFVRNGGLNFDCTHKEQS